MTKAETDLAKAIVETHYVELTSKAKRAAAETLAGPDHELVRVFEKDGKTWAKARTRSAYDTLAELE